MEPTNKRPIMQLGSRFWSVVVLIGIVLFLALSLFLSGCATIPSKTKWTTKYKDIFWFTVKKMELHENNILFKRIGSERPVIYITSIEIVQKEFARRTKESFNRFYKRLLKKGKTHEEATQEVDRYIKSVGAFFHPLTNDIYVGVNGHISNCRLRARIAHEIVHFLQVKVYGGLGDEENMISQRTKMRREFESLKIEGDFGQENCPEEAKTWKFYIM